MKIINKINENLVVYTRRSLLMMGICEVGAIAAIPFEKKIALMFLLGFVIASLIIFINMLISVHMPTD